MDEQNNLHTGMEDTQLIIPNWTPDDFKGTEPYKWLYEHRNIPTFKSLWFDVQEMAKTLQFSKQRFAIKWQEYENSILPKNCGDYDTNFPDQPIQLHCGKYICDEYGVAYLDRYGNQIDVCLHPIMPVARIINQDTAEQYIRIAFQRGGTWKTLDTEKTIAYSATKVVSLSGVGVGVTSESAKSLVSFLCDMESLNYDTLPEIRTTSRLGWHGNAFVPYDKTLQYIDNGNAQIVGSIKHSGDYNVWLNAIKATRNGEAKHLPARMAVAASFASPLLSKLGFLPFWLNLHSTISSSGKSVSVMLAASVWGNPDIGKGLPINANSTTNSLEVIASSLNNIPLFIDELQTAQKEKGFALTAYNLCEGSGKARLNRGAKLQPLLHWSLATISSGEQTVTNDLDHEGALARVVEIGVTEPVFSDPHAIVNTIKENFGFAGQLFIEALAGEDWNALREEANRISKLLQDKGVQLKQADSGAVVIIADRLAAKHIFHDQKNALTVEDVQTFLKLETDTDMNRRVYEHICGWCLQYKGYFESDDHQYVTQFYGKRVTDTHYRIAKNPLKAELARNGFNYDSFIEWCVQNGAMKDKSGTPAKQHLCKSSTRLLDFFTDAFDNEAETTEPTKAEAEPANPGTVVDVPDLPF